MALLDSRHGRPPFVGVSFATDRGRRITATRRKSSMPSHHGDAANDPTRASQTGGCPSIEFTTSARSSPVDAAVRQPKVEAAGIEPASEVAHKTWRTTRHKLACSTSQCQIATRPARASDFSLRRSCDGRGAWIRHLPARDFASRSRFGGSGLRGGSRGSSKTSPNAVEVALEADGARALDAIRRRASGRELSLTGCGGGLRGTARPAV